MQPRVAAVTMVYNEPEFVPLWVRHYGGQVGAAHCYVVDHGSEDGSTAGLGAVNVLRIPRSPKDDPKRTRFLSSFCSSLLEWYDAVIHVDVDELILPDPECCATLADYAAAMPADVVSAVGLNIHHVPDLEGEFDPARPVGAQRRWVRFTSAMCKPVILRKPLRWAPGFHCSDAPLAFGDLFLFHLRYHDLASGLRRLGRTRAMPWASEQAGSHQRMPDSDWSGMFHAIARLPRRAGVAFSPAASPMRDWLDRIHASEGQGEYPFRLDIDGDELWEIPERFRRRL